MASLTPIAACRRTAAKLLSMTVSEFDALVEAGSLPGPTDIGGFERWDVRQLQRIVSGDAADGMDDVTW